MGEGGTASNRATAQYKNAIGPSETHMAYPATYMLVYLLSSLADEMTVPVAHFNFVTSRSTTPIR